MSRIGNSPKKFQKKVMKRPTSMEKQVAAALLNMSGAPAAENATAPRSPERVVAQQKQQQTPPSLTYKQTATNTGRKRALTLDPVGPRKVQTHLVDRFALGPVRPTTFTTVHCLWRNNAKHDIFGPKDCSHMWRCVGQSPEGGLVYSPLVVDVRVEADETLKHLRLIHMRSPETHWRLSFSKKWPQLEKKKGAKLLFALLDAALMKLAV